MCSRTWRTRSAVRTINYSTTYCGCSARTARTLTTRHNLANWRAGHHAGAVTAFQQPFEDRPRLFDPNHPGHPSPPRLLARHWRGQAGEPTGVTIALQQLLDDMLGCSTQTTLTLRQLPPSQVDGPAEPNNAE